MMTKTREINIKPSCMSEIHGFPAEQTNQLWEKINYLVSDPFPDGKLKKKLKTHKGIYRMRVGDYRIFYTFGDTWVRLLGIRRRNERTFTDGLQTISPDTPADTPTDHDDIDVDELSIEEAARREFTLVPQQEQTPLPRPITAEWLTQLQIPSAYFPPLIQCTTGDQLLTVAVPASVIERVLDNLFPRSMEEVIQQPDLIVQDTQDLVKYKEGGLVSFLLKLDDDQSELTKWALSGPTMVTGGAGTGKSTVALYRAKALLDHDATGSATLLFTTYTNALTAASYQLLEQLLSKEQIKRVRVDTCDRLAREIVSGSRPISKMETSSSSIRVLRDLRKSFQPSAASSFEEKLRAKALESLSDRYLIEEFDWIIDGRSLTSLQDYLDAPRPGRGCVFRAGLREAVWELHSLYKAEMASRGIERWAALRSEALSLLEQGSRAGLYDYVVVDEAQDLAPAALCLLAELAKGPEGLFFAADKKQSLYSRNYSWTSAHPRLQFRGRTRSLKRNYRSTAEIDRAAFDVLEPEAEVALEPSSSIHTGPLPVLASGVSIEETPVWVSRFIRQMSQHLRMKTSASGVLVPTQEIGEFIASGLEDEGLPAQFFSGKDLDLNTDVVKVLTLHSAKGLEFPIVVVCGFEPGTYPTEVDFEDREVYLERMRNERRLLYVGLSRAMRGLMVIKSNSCNHEALEGLKPENWYLEEVK